MSSIISPDNRESYILDILLTRINGTITFKINVSIRINGETVAAENDNNISLTYRIPIIITFLGKKLWKHKQLIQKNLKLYWTT